MSAFLVQDKTINKVATYLYDARDFEGKKADLAEIGIGGAEQLAQAMFKLNLNSLNQRYGDDENQGETFEFRPEIADRYQVLKSLACWNYQCCEGDIPETSELYKIMEKVEALIAKRIVADMPEYESAEWD